MSESDLQAKLVFSFFNQLVPTANFMCAGVVHISASCCETREGVWKDQRQAFKV